MSTPDPRRAKDLARIHLAAKELGLDEATYRELLQSLTGRSSAGDLDARQRWQVLQELGRMGARSGGQAAHPGKPAPFQVALDCRRLMTKVEAHLADAKRPWAYAHAMAQRMFQASRVQDLDADQLHRLVAALEIDARRKGRV